MKAIKQVVRGGVLIGLLALVLSVPASAHVVVTPKEVLTSQRTTFAVSVPNEHDTPVVAVRLVIPNGLNSVRPYAKAGWNIHVASTGEGETTSASEITWTSAGSTVPVNLKDDFLFSAASPAQPTQLIWKAYETYQNGLVVAWEQTPSDTKDNKPYSVTQVVSETEQDKALQNATKVAEQADASARRSFYVAVGSVIIALLAIFFATRKK